MRNCDYYVTPEAVAAAYGLYGGLLEEDGPKERARDVSLVEWMLKEADIALALAVGGIVQVRVDGKARYAIVTGYDGNLAGRWRCYDRLVLDVAGIGATTTVGLTARSIGKMGQELDAVTFIRPADVPSGLLELARRQVARERGGDGR